MPASSLNPTQLTQAGYDEIVAELKELEEVKLPAIIKRVETARSYGDLSENAEYSSAKEDQNLTETRIEDLKQVLANSQVVSTAHHTGKINIGSTVVVELKQGRTKKRQTLHIVGEFEADPKTGKISAVSPIGQALLHRRIGDTVSIEVPAGKIEYSVLEVK